MSCNNLSMSGVFVYEGCSKCGYFLSENGRLLQTSRSLFSGVSVTVTKVNTILSPFSAFLTSNNGLQVSYENRKIFQLNQNGLFFIQFLSNSEFRVIKMKDHQCVERNSGVRGDDCFLLESDSENELNVTSDCECEIERSDEKMGLAGLFSFPND